MSASGRAERERQAHQGAIEVVCIPLLAGRHDPNSETRQQRAQLRLHGEHDLRAALRGQLGIAAKMNRVAECLIGVDEKGLARQVLLAEPGTCRACAHRVRAEPLAPFIQRQPLRKLTREQQAKAFVEMRQGVPGVELDGTVIARDGLRETPEIEQGIAAIAVVDRRNRILAYPELTLRQRFLGALEVAQRVGEIAMNPVHAGLQLERASPARERRGRPTQLVLLYAEVVVGIGEVRLQSQRAFAAGRRLLIPTQRLQHEPAVIVGHGEIRLERDGPLEARERFRQTSQAAQHVALVVVQFRGGRPQGDCPLETCECLGISLQLPQGYAAAGVSLDVIRFERDRLIEARHSLAETSQVP